jgi:hypothetical protein
MRVLKMAVMAGLLVAGCVQAKTMLLEPIIVNDNRMTTVPLAKDLSQNQMKKMNESLRLVLNNICSLACSEFHHRNITPDELYHYLQKHVEHYKMVSDEMMGYCKINKIEPCYISFEKEPAQLVNIFTDFKKDHPETPDYIQPKLDAAGLHGLGDY